MFINFNLLILLCTPNTPNLHPPPQKKKNSADLDDLEKWSKSDWGAAAPFAPPGGAYSRWTFCDAMMANFANFFLSLVLSSMFCHSSSSLLK